MRAAHGLQGRKQVAAVHARGGQELPRGRALLVGQGQKHVLGRDVRVAQGLGLLLGAVQRLGDLAGQGRLGGGTRLLGESLELPLRLGSQLGDVESHLLEQRDDDPVLLRKQGGEEMSVVDDWVTPGASERAGLLQGLGGLHGQTFWLNHGAGLLRYQRAHKNMPI